MQAAHAGRTYYDAEHGCAADAPRRLRLSSKPVWKKRKEAPKEWALFVNKPSCCTGAGGIDRRGASAPVACSAQRAASGGASEAQHPKAGPAVRAVSRVCRQGGELAEFTLEHAELLALYTLQGRGGVLSHCSQKAACAQALLSLKRVAARSRGSPAMSRSGMPERSKGVLREVRT